MDRAGRKGLDERIFLGTLETEIMTDEELDAEYAKMAEQYNMEVDKLKELFDKNSTAAMKGDYIAQKALHFVTDAAVEVAPKAAEEE